MRMWPYFKIEFKDGLSPLEQIEDVIEQNKHYHDPDGGRTELSMATRCQFLLTLQEVASALRQTGFSSGR